MSILSAADLTDIGCGNGHIWTRITPRLGTVCQRCRTPWGVILGTMPAGHVQWAEQLARKRADRVVSEKLGAGHGEAGRDPEVLLRRHRPGALAEAAVRHALGLPLKEGMENWSRRGDVGGREVRGSFHEHGHLPVFRPDPGGRKIVFVVLGDTGAYRICGWVYGHEAKKDEYLPAKGKLRPGSPHQWWVPQSCLRPIERL